MRIKGLFLLAVCLLAACGGQDMPATTAVPDLTEGVNMPAGFQLIGDHGGLQIDGDFVNLTFKQKGTITSDSVRRATISVTAESPILCFGSGDAAVILSIAHSGNAYTYTIGTKTQGGSVPWYLFDKVPNMETRSGLNVYDANGRVVFNSDYTPMKIASLTKISDGQPAISETLDFAAPKGAGTYAACLTLPKRTVQQTPNSILVYTQGIAATGSGATTSFFQVAQLGLGSSVITNFIGGYALVVDVAGL